jgi:hypothetical protein
LLEGGGIAEAVGLILMEWTTFSSLLLGMRPFESEKLANGFGSGTTKPVHVKPPTSQEEGLTEEIVAILRRRHHSELFYQVVKRQEPNLLKIMVALRQPDEYVAETENRLWQKMPQLVSYCKPALRYIDLLQNRTFQQFCTDFKLDSVTTTELSGCTC